MSYQLYNADCLDVLLTLDAGSVDAVITSPPYAEQRKKQYGGIPENEYPSWTVAWLEALRPALRSDGSVLINIREHVKDGQISDYVHKTRLAVRAAGWMECEELIWIKPDGPPVGHVNRPRRSWERVLWFAQSEPWVNTRNGGQPSKRLGMARATRGAGQWLHGPQGEHREGVARCQDYISISVGHNASGLLHPAAYPVALAEWLMGLVARHGSLVLDPFMGSGTTGVACMQTGRHFIGVEIDAGYLAIAQDRLAAASAQLRMAV